MELYGTYLSHLIKNQLMSTGKALSVKEIALVLHIYESQREQYNLEKRVRFSINKLVDRREVELIPHKIEGKNIFVTKYKLI